MPNTYEQCVFFPRSNRQDVCLPNPHLSRQDPGLDKWSPSLKIFGRYSDREWITFVLLYLVRIIKIELLESE
jgi:hypothetical protein